MLRATHLHYVNAPFDCTAYILAAITCPQALIIHSIYVYVHVSVCVCVQCLNMCIYYILLHYFGRRDPQGGEGVVGG